MTDAAETWVRVGAGHRDHLLREATADATASPTLCGRYRRELPKVFGVVATSACKTCMRIRVKRMSPDEALIFTFARALVDEALLANEAKRRIPA